MSDNLTQTLSRDAALEIGQRGAEPQWMRDLRARAWEIYEAAPMPTIMRGDAQGSLK